MGGKAIIFEQLRREAVVVKKLLIKEPKPDLRGAMEMCRSLRSITDKHIWFVRALFHAALIVDPFYLSPKPQKLSRLHEEFGDIVDARDQSISFDQLQYTEDQLWVLSDRNTKAAEEGDPLINRLEVQAFREDLIRLLTGMRVVPVVNRWRKK